MEWDNNSYKELENKTMMDMTLIPRIGTVECDLGPSEKGNTNRAVKPRKKLMTSVYLKFFETAPDGKSRRCKFCKQSYSIATATGNLGRHLSHHHPGYNQQGGVSQHVPRATAVVKKPHVQVKHSSLDFDHLNLMLVKWLIGAYLPFFTVVDDLCVDSLKILNFSAQLWSREKICAVTHEVFRSIHEDVRASLRQVKSKISITLDFWTSCEQIFYMSVEGHWIDENWSYHKVLLDVCHIPFPRGSPEIYHALNKVLKSFNLDKRIFSCTHDDSQPAIQACCALKEEFDARKMLLFYIPCASRTLNFIIEDCLKYSRPILSKIREFIFKLNESAEVCEEFRLLTVSYQECSWKFPLDASSQWTGDYMVLDIALKASNSMEAIIRKHEETFGSRNMLLSPVEKSLINTLHAYLEPFYKITTDLCNCKVPTTGLVLFFMDHVFEMISSFRDTCCIEWFKNPADDMLKRAMNFSSQAYNLFSYMSAILDPRIKKELVPEKLNTSKNLEDARSHFIRHYSTSQFPPDEGSTIPFAEEIVRKRRMASMGSATDELSQYLSEPLVPMSTDVLEWWKVNSTRYPCLAVMARDYLAVQGTAVEPINVFSRKGEDIRKQRFCLPHDSMKAVLCIQSWARSGYNFRFRSSEIDYEKLAELSFVPCNASAGLDKKGGDGEK